MKRLSVLLPVLLLTACSGGSGSSGVSKAAYLKKAEAVCTKAVTQQNALKAPASIPAFAVYVRSLVTIAQKTTESLAGLKPPDADKKALQDKVLTPLQEQLKTAQTFADNLEAATKKNDQAALNRLAANTPTKPKADLEFMRGYGFQSCVDAADTSN